MSISKERAAQIKALPDEQIEYSEIPELDESFWERAVLHMPEPKKGIYIRLDADILAWLKVSGKGYQTRLNAMLRALMEQDQHKSSNQPSA